MTRCMRTKHPRVQTGVRCIHDVKRGTWPPAPQKTVETSEILPCLNGACVEDPNLLGRPQRSRDTQTTGPQRAPLPSNDGTALCVIISLGGERSYAACQKLECRSHESTFCNSVAKRASKRRGSCLPIQYAAGSLLNYFDEMQACEAFCSASLGALGTSLYGACLSPPRDIPG